MALTKKTRHIDDGKNYIAYPPSNFNDVILKLLSGKSIVPIVSVIAILRADKKDIPEIVNIVMNSNTAFLISLFLNIILVIIVLILVKSKIIIQKSE